MEKIKWGIIGPGKIASRFVEDFLHVNDQTHTVTAILAKDKPGASRAASKYKTAKVFTEMGDFLAACIDVVYIATPHTFHFFYARECLRAKIPVLCEKPICINSTQLDKLISLSHLNETFLMEGMWIRFLPSIKKVLEILDEGWIGSIVSIKASMSYRAPKDSSNRYFNPELGGGSLLDLGVYPVFLSTLLLGKPAEIKTVGAVTEAGIDEACSILLDYQNNQFASLESTIIAQTESIAEIFGQGGKITILSPWNEMPKEILLNIYEGNKEFSFPCIWPGSGFQFEMVEVANCLSQNRIESSLMPHSLSRNVIEIMDQVREQLNVTYSKFE